MAARKKRKVSPETVRARARRAYARRRELELRKRAAILKAIDRELNAARKRDERRAKRSRAAREKRAQKKREPSSILAGRMSSGAPLPRVSEYAELLRTQAAREAEIAALIESLRQKDEKLKTREDAIARLNAEMLGLVPDGDPELIKMDGTIAKYPSRMRTQTRHVKTRIYERLLNAESNEHLTEEIMTVAQDFRLSVREIYSFFFSP